jgi:hypothetical protein
MLDRIDEAHLPGVLAARAAARERAWAAGAGSDLTGLPRIDVDATITVSHSEHCWAPAVETDGGVRDGAWVVKSPACST